MQQTVFKVVDHADLSNHPTMSQDPFKRDSESKDACPSHPAKNDISEYYSSCYLDPIRYQEDAEFAQDAQDTRIVWDVQDVQDAKKPDRSEMIKTEKPRAVDAYSLSVNHHSCNNRSSIVSSPRLTKTLQEVRQNAKQRKHLPSQTAQVIIKFSVPR